MTEEKIIEAFRSTPDESPIWKALNQVIDETLDDEVSATILPVITPDARTYNAGRAAAIRDFKAVIEHLHARHDGKPE